jgi:hypothetical protein
LNGETEMNALRTIGTVAVSVAMLVLVAGCESNAESGALIGAGGGALAGQAIGHNTTGTLIGAGAGALGGYLIGGQMDKNAEAKAKAKSQDVTAPRQSGSSVTTTSQSSSVTTPANDDAVKVTVTIRNSNGSTTPVALTRQGGDWVGPKGEHYDHMPTEAELKPIYGF